MDRDTEPDTGKDTGKGRPPSVMIALGALAVVIIAQTALAFVFAREGQVGWGMYAFALALWGTLVTGVARGSRLAWLWARYLTPVLGVIMAASLAAGMARHDLGWGVAAAGLLGLVVPLVTAGLMLGRPAAVAFFGLVCPSCGHRTSVGADLLFRKARCRGCRNEW